MDRGAWQAPVPGVATNRTHSTGPLWNGWALSAAPLWSNTRSTLPPLAIPSISSFGLLAQTHFPSFSAHLSGYPLCLEV